MTQRVVPARSAADQARLELCHRLSQAIQEGQSGIQVRLIQAGKAPAEIWIYTQQHHEWKKRDELGMSSELSEPLRQMLEGLFHQRYCDAWTCHKAEHHDRVDYELKFSQEAIESHRKGNLESYITGCLSHAHHDSGQDSRRRMGFKGQ